MKKILLKLLFIFLLSIGLLFIGNYVFADTIEIDYTNSVENSRKELQIGDEIWVKIMVNDSSAYKVSTVMANIDYDEAVLEPVLNNENGEAFVEKGENWTIASMKLPEKSLMLYSLNSNKSSCAISIKFRVKKIEVNKKNVSIKINNIRAFDESNNEISLERTEYTLKMKVYRNTALVIFIILGIVFSIFGIIAFYVYIDKIKKGSK